MVFSNRISNLGNCGCNMCCVASKRDSTILAIAKVGDNQYDAVWTWTVTLTPFDSNAINILLLESFQSFSRKYLYLTNCLYFMHWMLLPYWDNFFSQIQPLTRTRTRTKHTHNSGLMLMLMKEWWWKYKENSICSKCIWQYQDEKTLF